MSSRIIPKEELTAYQRWELGVFDDAGDRPPARQATAATEAQAAGTDMSADAAALPLPTAEELERIHQEAYQEGYRLGLEEGRRQGEAYSRQMKILLDGMQAARLAQDEELARALLEFGLVLARQVVGTVFKAKPELMLETVREALAQLPHLSGHPRLVAHPDNAAMLRDWLAQEYPHVSWRVVEDPHMAPGGFRVEVAQAELDADLAGRWRAALLSLGADAAWLE